MQLSTPVRWFVHGSLAILAIWLGSTYLIQYGTKLPSKSQKAENGTAKFQPVKEAKFRSLLDAGNKAMRDGQYAEALSSFLEAERSGDRLSDEQYESLKNARLQVAQLYAAADDLVSANTAYRALADCAVREGNILVQAKDYESAVKRGQDGEEFSYHLIEGKHDSLQGSLFLLVSSFDLVHRYSEATDAAHRLIDYLTSVDQYDQAIGQAYSMLAGVQGDAKEWAALDQTLSQYIDWCDRTHEHLIAETRGPYMDTTIPRSWAQYNLIIARYQGGDPDSALSKADDFFTEYLQKERESTPMRPLNVAFHSGDFAALALQIAKESNRPNAIDLWQKRVPGGIKVVSIHPVESR